MLSIMKTIYSRITILFVALTTLFSFTSCDEDFWFDDDYWEEGWIDRAPYIEGEWRVDDIHGHTSTYQPGDLWTFDYHRKFFTDGYKLKEEGEWWWSGRYLKVRFLGNRNISIEAYVRSYHRDYMILDVRDFEYDERYTLRLVKERNYSQQKELVATFPDSIQ